MSKERDALAQQLVVHDQRTKEAAKPKDRKFVTTPPVLKAPANGDHNGNG